MPRAKQPAPYGAPVPARVPSSSFSTMPPASSGFAPPTPPTSSYPQPITPSSSQYYPPTQNPPPLASYSHHGQHSPSSYPQQGSPLSPASSFPQNTQPPPTSSFPQKLLLEELAHCFRSLGSFLNTSTCHGFARPRGQSYQAPTSRQSPFFPAVSSSSLPWP